MPYKYEYGAPAELLWRRTERPRANQFFMATLTYRKLDANGEPLLGNGQANFVRDLDAVAQSIATRLKLLQGEWWENLNAGTPLFQSMLGVAGAGTHPEAITLLLKQRILGTPFVTGIQAIETSYDGASRAFRFSCQVATQFGTVTVSLGQPGTPSLP